MKVIFEARLDSDPVSLFVIVLLSMLVVVSRTSVRLNRILPAVLPLKMLFSIEAVRTLLSADISRGTLETEVWPSKVLFEQTRVDVPSRFKKIPLTLSKKWLSRMDMEAFAGNVASIAKVVVFVNVQEETFRLWRLTP